MAERDDHSNQGTKPQAIVEKQVWCKGIVLLSGFKGKRL